MPKPPRPSSAAHQPPLVGRGVHLLVIASGAIGAGWYGWTLASTPVARSALAVTGGALLLALWMFVYAPADPESKPVSLIAVPGRVLVIMEVALIVAGGAALWSAWHRAAGEAYMTFAFIDLFVRYYRFAPLWRDNATPPADTGR